MQWREIIVHTTTDGADLLSELMMELGASGTEIVDRADVPDPTSPAFIGSCTIKSCWKICRRMCW